MWRENAQGIALFCDLFEAVRGFLLPEWSNFFMRSGAKYRGFLSLLVLLFGLGATVGAQQARCHRIVFEGEVVAGQSYAKAIGEGWVFALQPIRPGLERGGYSGWDLIVDREKAQGYPDALLLMTPPYRSINEREIGTSYGLRAQDALGWSQRSFRFLTSESEYEQARGLYREIEAGSGQANVAAGKIAGFLPHTASGELRILKARIVPGQADAASFAENWAVASARVEHTVEPATNGKATARGEIRQLSFRVTLWLPESFHVAARVAAPLVGCGEVAADR